MANLDDIMELTVISELKSPDKTSFNIALFITDTAPQTFTDMFRLYKEPKELIADGFLITDKAYIAASSYFAQSPRPSKLMVAPLTKKDDKSVDDIITCITKITDANNSWYALGIYSKTPDDVLNVARYIETTKKMFLTSTNSKDVSDTPYKENSKDIGSLFKKNSFKSSGIIFSNDSDKYPEIGAIGLAMAYDAGTATLAYKTIAGIKPDYISTTKYNNLESKNVNTYEEISGINVLRYGKFSAGNFIDIKITMDFINARIQECFYSLLTKKDKILYSKVGLMQLESKFIEFLDYAAKTKKIIDENYKINMPDISKISDDDKINGVLSDVSYEFTVLGSIVKIKAKVIYKI